MFKYPEKYAFQYNCMEKYIRHGILSYFLFRNFKISVTRYRYGFNIDGCRVYGMFKLR